MAFRGPVITLPIGLQGFSGSRNPSKLGPGHFSYVEAVDNDGEVIIKENGATKFNVGALAGNVRSGANWSPVPGSHDDIIVTSNAHVYKDTGAGTFPTDMGAYTLPAIYQPQFVRAGGEGIGSTRKLFIFGDGSQVKVISGTGATIASITTPPADWTASFPIFGVLHANRLWGGGAGSDPHRIYYSLPTDHQVFTGAGSGNLPIYPAEGEQLVGGLSYRGLLVLWKYPKGIYIVNTSDADITKWSVSRLTDAVGAIGPHGIVQIGNDVLYLMNDGTFHLMSATQEFGDVNTSNISRDPNYFDVFMRANVGLASLRQAQGIWYAAKSKAIFGVPLAGNTTNNLRITIDFNNAQAGPRYYLSRRDECRALWLRPGADSVYRPVETDSLANIWNIDVEGVLNKGGLPYLMQFETSETDFSFADPNLAARTKNGAYIEITADVQRSSTLIIIPYWDGQAADPILLTLNTEGAALDAFTLDIDALSATGTVIARHPLTGQGRRLKFSVTNSTPEDEVRISEFRVGYTVADERSAVTQ